MDRLSGMVGGSGGPAVPAMMIDQQPDRALRPRWVPMELPARRLSAISRQLSDRPSPGQFGGGFEGDVPSSLNAVSSDKNRYA